MDGTEDFSFDWDGLEETPTETPTQPDPQPTTPQPDPQFEELRRQNEALMRRQQDIERFFGGQQNQLSPDEQALARFKQDLVQELLPQMASISNDQMIVNEFRSNNPELLPYEDYINMEVQKVMEQARTQGKQIDFRSAIESGIQSFKTRFPQLSGQQSNPREAMRLDLNGTSRPGPQTSEDRANAIWNMSPEKFAEFDRNISRKF